MSGGQRKMKRTMQYWVLYHPETDSYFCNKSNDPRSSARRNIHRAFNKTRADYDTNPLYIAVREYGEDAFIVRYSTSKPSFVERRAHYVQHDAPNEEHLKEVMSMMENPIPPVRLPPKHVIIYEK